jgi:hypothetical protein
MIFNWTLLKRPRLTLGAWIAVGLIGGAAVLPTATYAATGRSLVTITDGKSANTATVDSAGRLLAAQSAPAQMVAIRGDFLNSKCNNFYTVPKTKALIITAADFLLSSPGDGAGHFIEGDVYANLGPNCTVAAPTRYIGSGAAPVADGSLIEHQDQNHEYGTGIAVPAGTVIGDYGQDTTGNVLLFGYLVPKGSVPGGALTTLPGTDRTGRPLVP